MKPQAGYTVMELLITVGILTTLTSISMVSLSAPKTLIEKEALFSSIASVIHRAQSEPLLTGKTVRIAFTQQALWLNDRKTLVLPENGPWAWQGKVNEVSLFGDSSLSLVDTNGKHQDLPQAVILTYNQKSVARIALNPERGTIKLLKADQLDTLDAACKN